MTGKFAAQKQTVLLTVISLMALGLSGCGERWGSAEEVGRKAGQKVDTAIAQVQQAYDDLGEPGDGPAEKLGEVVDNGMVALFDFIRDALDDSIQHNTHRHSEESDPLKGD